VEPQRRFFAGALNAECCSLGVFSADLRPLVAWPALSFLLNIPHELRNGGGRRHADNKEWSLIAVKVTYCAMDERKD